MKVNQLRVTTFLFAGTVTAIIFSCSDEHDENVSEYSDTVIIGNRIECSDLEMHAPYDKETTKSLSVTDDPVTLTLLIPTENSNSDMATVKLCIFNRLMEPHIVGISGDVIVKKNKRKLIMKKVVSNNNRLIAPFEYITVNINIDNKVHRELLSNDLSMGWKLSSVVYDQDW